MKIPYKIKFYDPTFKDDEIMCGEWAKLPSGKIVVMAEGDSYWFDEKGKNPKSYLEFMEIEDKITPNENNIETKRHDRRHRSK